MTIAGASEKIPGVFWDKGGHVYNILHPDFGGVQDFGVTNNDAAIAAAIAQADADGGGLVVIPFGCRYTTATLTIPEGVTVLQHGDTVDTTVGGTKFTGTRSTTGGGSPLSQLIGYIKRTISGSNGTSGVAGYAEAAHSTGTITSHTDGLLGYFYQTGAGRTDVGNAVVGLIAALAGNVTVASHFRAKQPTVTTGVETHVGFYAEQINGGSSANYCFLGNGGVMRPGDVIQTESAQESTGAGTPQLGTNCPASTLTAPYKWLKFKTSDGSTVYLPAWK